MKASDLNTITTKKIRRTLEEQTGTSLEPIKKEINRYIEEIFVNFQQPVREASLPVVKKTVNKKPDTTKVLKKSTPATIKKTVTKKKEPKERKPIDWPILKVSPPLSDIINTNLVSE